MMTVECANHAIKTARMPVMVQRIQLATMAVMPVRILKMECLVQKNVQHKNMKTEENVKYVMQIVWKSAQDQGLILVLLMLVIMEVMKMVMENANHAMKIVMEVALVQIA